MNMTIWKTSLLTLLAGAGVISAAAQTVTFTEAALSRSDAGELAIQNDGVQVRAYHFGRGGVAATVSPWGRSARKRATFP